MVDVDEFEFVEFFELFGVDLFGEELLVCVVFK